MSRRNVSNNMDFLILQLGALKFINEPLQFGSRVGAVEQEPPVLVVAVVHVEGDDAKTWTNEHRIKGAATYSRTCARRQPVAPLSVHLFVKPIDRVVLLHKWWWKTAKL
jgi:hypothetical protein